MDYPDLTVSNFMGNSIDLKRIKQDDVDDVDSQMRI